MTDSFDGRFLLFIIFFFNDTATTEIYTLSLHDALPISPPRHRPPADPLLRAGRGLVVVLRGRAGLRGRGRRASPGRRVRGERRWTLLVVCLATGVQLLNVSAPSVALPEIGRDLAADLSMLQWV